MYCPQCGQQQLSDNLRFCSRCGFPLEAVLQILATGGMLPTLTPKGTAEPSPRRKGVKQGALMMLLGVILVPLLGVLNSFNAGNLFDILKSRAVRDYIDLGWWPVFNLVDVAILGGLAVAFLHR